MFVFLFILFFFCFEKKFVVIVCFLSGYTALIWASYKGHVDVIKVLLENGANMNLQDKQ